MVSPLMRVSMMSFPSQVTVMGEGRAAIDEGFYDEFPPQVTVMGEGRAAASLNFLMMSPAADGEFFFNLRLFNLRLFNVRLFF